MPFIGNKPSAVPLTSADIADSIITSSKIVDATIANADIANSTINLTTKVTGTLPVANGGTGLAALGTSLQVLRTNTGATALEFATPATGAFTFLGETSASNVATVDLNGYFTSSYDYYQIYLDDVYTATNNVSTRMQFATTGAYTVQTSTYYWISIFGEINGALSSSSDGLANTTNLKIMPYTSSTSTQTSNAVITIFNPMGSNAKNFVSNFTSVYGSPVSITAGTNGGRWNNTAAITGVRFFASSGNIYARKIRIYGITNS